MTGRASRYARLYYSLGWNPIPSRTDVKGPACQDYAAYRDHERIPEKWLDRWWSPNVQVATGVAWGLAVVDLDGPEAKVRWHSWARERGCPETWTVMTGGGGIHLWFRLPADLPACPSRKVWGILEGGKYRPHTWIEVLADRALVIAPPSRHVDPPHAPYRFLKGPRDLPAPAQAPGWVLDLPALEKPRRPPASCRPIRPRPWRLRRPGLPSRDETLGRLSAAEKLDIARRWGLRFAATKPTATGWYACHAIGREDFHPSAGFHAESGVYWEAGKASLSFFDLGVALGVYGSWGEACQAVGEMT